VRCQWKMPLRTYAREANKVFAAFRSDVCGPTPARGNSRGHGLTIDVGMSYAASRFHEFR
jgi:hypothetical protein